MGFEKKKKTNRPRPFAKVRPLRLSTGAQRLLNGFLKVHVDQSTIINYLRIGEQR